MSTSQRIEFSGSQGDKLAARLELPESPLRGVSLFAHCFTCSKETKAASHIARAMVAQGFGLLRFDFTGLGGSDGDFANTSFSSNIGDLMAAVAWLRTHHQAPAIMIGHSLGGAATLAAAGLVPECRAVVTIGAPFDPAHVRAQFENDMALIERDGQAQVSIAGRPFTISRDFIRDLDGQPQQDRIAGLRKALLVLHAPGDQVVGVDNARRIFEAAKHPKSFVSLDSADHLLNRETDARYVAGLIGAWAGRYLDKNALPSAAEQSGGSAAVGQNPDVSNVPVPEGLVRVSERSPDGFAASVRTPDHHLVADEPTSFGGTNQGLSPYELLQAALGSCTTMTIRMAANRRKLPLEHVQVDCHHEKIHAADCDSCETREGRVDRIERVITLEGPLDEAQRAWLLSIADKCPVHRTLHSEVSITTRLA